MRGAEGRGLGERRRGEGSNIPLGRVLQAAICAVVDGFAEAFNHFAIYGHDGRSHGRFERQATIRKVGHKLCDLPGD
jgi:hypothetical protein